MISANSSNARFVAALHFIALLQPFLE